MFRPFMNYFYAILFSKKRNSPSLQVTETPSHEGIFQQETEMKIKGFINSMKTPKAAETDYKSRQEFPRKKYFGFKSCCDFPSVWIQHNILYTYILINNYCFSL